MNKRENLHKFITVYVQLIPRDKRHLEASTPISFRQILSRSTPFSVLVLLMLSRNRWQYMRLCHRFFPAPLPCSMGLINPCSLAVTRLRHAPCSNAPRGRNKPFLFVHLLKKSGYFTCYLCIHNIYGWTYNTAAGNPIYIFSSLCIPYIHIACKMGIPYVQYV